MRNAVLGLTLGAFVAAPVLGQAGTLAFKQLAGPPAEFETMAPAETALAAQSSTSALLPITLSPDGGGSWSWEYEIPVEGPSVRFLLYSEGASGGTAGAWSLMTEDPAGGGRRSVAAMGIERRGIDFLPTIADLPVDLYDVAWSQPRLPLAIESPEPGEGFLLVEGAGPARLVSFEADREQRVGQQLTLLARVVDRDDESGEGYRLDSARLRIETPDGGVLVREMFDDGGHRDGDPGDGLYGASFVAETAGEYHARVIVAGRDPQGQDFVRTAEHLLPVIEDDLRLRPEPASGEIVGERRLAVRLSVDTPQTRGHVRAYAEVWGSPGTGGEATIPIAWIGGMTEVDGGSLQLGLDTRWIALAGAREPFELRNVRIEDPDHFIPRAFAERIELLLPALPASARRPPAVVDEEMLMGPRPAALDARGTHPRSHGSTGIGHKLLLVHGYCSSDVWGGVAGQFTNAARFLDLGQNRSHDEFALRIAEFGESWQSYAIVAHSQGGAAALHLFNYYWSGLDHSGGGRLIQSVGTPYRGTNLAGILALLGSWFGAGCGSNGNLTYSGADQWLSGISTTSRARVSYHTTSFTDDFGYDYCHLATDFLLSDPDDGVVEQEKGQLSGGDNRGHKEGWCHSSDMRDPPQTTDAGRNAIMSLEAAIGPPGVITDTADGIGLDTATLHGTAHPGASLTTVWFEWGTTTTYDQIAAMTSVGAGTDPVAFSGSITGLDCATTYHFRAVAQSSGGTSVGSDRMLQTLACNGAIFTSGFESGGVGDWSSSAGGG